MIRNLLVGLVMLLVVLLVIGFMLPSNVQVSRSIVINSSPSNIFGVVDGFRQFDRWSPWAAKDPAMKVQLSGALYGVGAHYEWSGNKEVGTGSQEIIESTPYSEVKIRVLFGGFQQPNIAVFSLEPATGQGTKVTWALHANLGDNPIWRYFGLMMDRMVGADYERGLSALKTYVERQSKTDFGSLHPELVDLQPQTIAYLAGHSSTDIDVIGKALGEAYGKIGIGMKAAGLKMAGAPLAITTKFDDEANVYEFDAGIPVDRGDAKLPADGPVKLMQTYAGLALKVRHKGPYSKLPDTYALIDAFKHSYALQDNGNSWEQYVDDPTTKPAAEVETLIFVPVN
jgi:effector-binding domain-containing protein